MTPQFIALLIVVVLAFLLRLALNLSHDAFLGVDGGAYLLSRNYVLGDEPTGAGFPRPPLAPGWLLAPFTAIWGDNIGYKVWAAVAAGLPAIPVYLLTKQHLRNPWAPTFAVGFLSLDLMHSEMMVTGALPLIGFALIGIAWWAAGNLPGQRNQLGNSIILAVALGLTPWVNQTSAGLIAIALPIYITAILWFGPYDKWSSIRRLLPPLAVGGVIGLGALPWYLDIAPNSSILHFGGGHWIYPSPLGDVAWLQAIMAVALGWWAWRKAADYRLRSLGVALIALGLLAPWLSYDETVINVFYRSGYLMAVAFYPLAAWLVFKFWIPNLMEMRDQCRFLYGDIVVAKSSLMLASIFTAAGIMLSGYVWQHYNQQKYSEMATPATLAALEQIKAVDPNSGIITNSFTLSLYVAALTKVRSPFLFTAEPPRAYTQDDNDIRCLLGWVDGCKPLESKRRLAVGYVLIDMRFPNLNKRSPGNYLAPPNQWEATNAAPWLQLVFEQGTTRVWKILDQGY